MKEQREAEHEDTVRELALNRCPKCGVRLTTRLIEEVEIDECGQCQGMWLDKVSWKPCPRRRAVTGSSSSLTAWAIS